LSAVTGNSQKVCPVFQILMGDLECLSTPV
jgi:hypothetical protein